MQGKGGETCGTVVESKGRASDCRGAAVDLLVELGKVRADLLDELLGVEHAHGGGLNVHEELALEVRLGLVLEDGPLDGEDELPSMRRE